MFCLLYFIVITLILFQPRGYAGPHTIQPLRQDNYAGLMTLQEKQWLCSIQNSQLNSNNPLQDDYYYTVSISYTVFPYEIHQQLINNRQLTYNYTFVYNTCTC